MNNSLTTLINTATDMIRANQTTLEEFMQGHQFHPEQREFIQRAIEARVATLDARDMASSAAVDTGDTHKTDVHQTVVTLIHGIKPEQERSLLLKEFYAALQATPEIELLDKLGEALTIIPPKEAMAVCKRLMSKGVWAVYANEQAVKKAAERERKGIRTPPKDTGYQITEHDMDELHGLLDLAYGAAFSAAFPWADDMEPLPYYTWADADGRWINALSVSHAMTAIEAQVEAKRDEEAKAAHEARASLKNLFANVKKPQ